MLERAADTILHVCMGLKKNESCLIVYDKNKSSIADLLVMNARCAKIDKIQIPVAKFNGEEPPKSAAIKMKQYDVAILVTTRSLSHTKARREASKRGVRIASMPNATEDMINRTLTADYNKIDNMNKKILNSLKNKKRIRLLTDKGTDLKVYINKCFNDNGFYNKKGNFGNLPAGEVGFAPVEGKTNGIAVIDKTMAGIGRLRSPLRLEIKDGFVKKIDGKKDSLKLIKLLNKLKNKNVYNIAEFSIGTNYKAKITGIPLEDEKVYGTVHIAIGDNRSYPGGRTKAPTHLDGIISKPTIFVEKKKIMEEGVLFQHKTF
jgi:leucyl aminopeptidase (aminopeptidase T)